MRWPLKPFTLGLLCVLAAGSVCAAPTTAPAPAKPSVPAKPSASITPAKPPVTPKPPAPVPTALPDYGGRDSAPIMVNEAAPNPAAQAGRALLALLIVLAGVIGVVYGLKRFGLVTPGADGKPARITLPGGFGRTASLAPGTVSAPVTVLSSQVLPGGAMLHVVSVAGRTLLLAATSHTVTTVAEWAAEAEPAEEAAAFEDYLTRARTGPQPPEPGSLAAANARLRSLLSHSQPGEYP